MQLTCAAVLFDLDGVLIESTDNITRHWQQWARRHQLDLATIMQVAHGRRTIETMALVAPHLGAAEEALLFAALEAADTEGVIAIDGAVALLRTLPPDAWAIVTSGTRDVATARLKSQGIPVPLVMVTAEDVVNGKPHPEPYLLAAARLGIPPQRCVVVEDSPAGIAAACAAGMRSVAVASTHAPSELNQATAIAMQLSDIRVDNHGDGSLVIRTGTPLTLQSTPPESKTVSDTP
jgi:mannitol-1-/sugar-/sorbitol-6-phosphatase